MSEMVEKVARAIARYDWADPAHPFKLSAEELDAREEEGWRGNIGVARAAIEAMREPAERMLEAGAKGSGEDSQGVADGAWQAMIDAALKE